ncbi:zinc ribbon domain-containing protein [Anaerocolumna sp. AGMB13025]|uniref:zinc ribbon domain-containing protein n=1 Tax=Anaerocolumna sp. AGMB13025 TaxID=3039116 RepID=UPI00241D5F92|nr:zinc ribbon domain-containing protein [Anaerocolumna sp. AGMB13025]WFR59256.1 zinc ribbon domain-containing protein [Anaerocolumna sp. AGMB13025]
MKICISCGMPMTKAEDYPLKDESKDYCIYCARTDGSLQSFEEKKEGMSEFLMRTQGIDRAVAHKTAEEFMKKQPAWENYFDTV